MKRAVIALILLPVSIFADQYFSRPTHFQADVDWTSGLVLDLGGNRLRNVANPVANSDAATKFYVDNAGGGGGSGVWGGITGDINDQSDLQSEFATKMAVFTPGNITRTNDTNVTLTLGGTPTASTVSNGVSFTVGWSGTLAVARGGTGAATAPAFTYFGNDTGSTATPGFHQINFNQLLGVAAQNQAGLPSGGTGGQILQKNSSGDYDAIWVSQASNIITGAITVTFDGQGSVITGGVDYFISVPYTGTITEATLLGDVTGSIIIEVRKCTYTQFDAGATHPSSGDKINSFTPPTITTATKSDDTTLSGWTTAFTAGDIFGFHVNGTPVNIKRAVLVLKTIR